MALQPRTYFFIYYYGIYTWLFWAEIILYLPNITSILANIIGVIFIVIGLKKILEIRLKRTISVFHPRVISYIPKSLGIFH